MTRQRTTRSLLLSFSLALVAAVGTSAMADEGAWKERRAWGWGDGYHSAYRWCGGCRGCDQCGGCQKGAAGSNAVGSPWRTPSDWTSLWPQPATPAPLSPTLPLPFVGQTPGPIRPRVEPPVLPGRVLPDRDRSRRDGPNRNAPNPPAPRPLNPPSPSAPLAPPTLRDATTSIRTPAPVRMRTTSEATVGPQLAAPTRDAPQRIAPFRGASSTRPVSGSARNWAGSIRSTN